MLLPEVLKKAIDKYKNTHQWELKQQIKTGPYF